MLALTLTIQTWEIRIRRRPPALAISSGKIISSTSPESSAPVSVPPLEPAPLHCLPVGAYLEERKEKWITAIGHPFCHSREVSGTAGKHKRGRGGNDP